MTDPRDIRMADIDWQTMETAPLNPYGKAYGPTVLIWCDADATPWPAYYSPWHEWEHRDCGPAWIIPDQEPPIAPEDAVAWAWITPPKGEEGSAGVKKSLTVAERLDRLASAHPMQHFPSTKGDET